MITDDKWYAGLLFQAIVRDYLTKFLDKYIWLHLYLFPLLLIWNKH